MVLYVQSSTDFITINRKHVSQRLTEHYMLPPKVSQSKIERSSNFSLLLFLTVYEKSRFSEARIPGILRQQDQGQTVVQICREHGIGESTFYA